MKVLEFVEELRAPLQQKVTVRRATSSKWLFLTVVRAYQHKLHAKPSFVTYVKQKEQELESFLEEASLWKKVSLLVVEGAPKGMVDRIKLPSLTYLVAETDEGELELDDWGRGSKRDVLRVLLDQLGIQLRLRDLIKLDWSSCRSFEEAECFLRKAQILGWNEEEIGKHLDQTTDENVLSLWKRGRMAELFSLKERLTPAGMVGLITKLTIQTAQCKALKLLGYDDVQLQKEMGVSWWKTKQLLEAESMLGDAEVKRIADRLVKLDKLLSWNPGVGLDLLLLNSGVSVRRV